MKILPIFPPNKQETAMMPVDKERFRELVESEKVGQALNQLSDVSHFLGEGDLQEQLQSIAERYQELQELEEGSEEAEAQRIGIRNDLLELIEQLPEEFSGESGSENGSGGCLGALLALVTLTILLLQMT